VEYRFLMIFLVDVYYSHLFFMLLSLLEGSRFDVNSLPINSCSVNESIGLTPYLSKIDSAGNVGTE